MFLIFKTFVKKNTALRIGFQAKAVYLKQGTFCVIKHPQSPTRRLGEVKIH